MRYNSEIFHLIIVPEGHFFLGEPALGNKPVSFGDVSGHIGFQLPLFLIGRQLQTDAKHIVR